MPGSHPFFNTPEPVSLGSLARSLDCTLRSDSHADVTIVAVAPVEAADAGCLTFLSNPKYISAVRKTKAGAVICSPRHAGLIDDETPVLINAQPYRTFANAMKLLFPAAMRPLPMTSESGIAAGAFVDGSAHLEDNVTVEHGAVIGEGASIGTGAHIGPGATIGANVQIGRDTTIAASASVIHSVVGDRVIIHCGARIGCDGFGFAMGAAGHLKIPQIGRVVIQDDVEIGANTCIDRGANRDTIVGEGTKIDGMVMIGHNNVIGRHCVISGQTGIAGSTTLGDFVVLGGQVAVNGHITVGTGVQVAGNSAIYEDVEPGQRIGGNPARPIKLWMREKLGVLRDAKRQDKMRSENPDE